MKDKILTWLYLNSHALGVAALIIVAVFLLTR
jgi:hypothetical protein